MNTIESCSCLVLYLVLVLPVVLNNIIVEKYQKQVFHYFPRVPPGTYTTQLSDTTPPPHLIFVTVHFIVFCGHCC